MTQTYFYLNLAESLNNLWNYLRERVETLDRLEWKSLNLERRKRKENSYQVIQL